jgi:hypothetical protein
VRLTMAFVGGLIWHHPLVPAATVAQLLVAQVVVGTFLSIYWRRSGNLMAPGFAHAASDAVRNTLRSFHNVKGARTRRYPCRCGKEPISSELWKATELAS